ncbi:hypothetical protein AgCh_026274 [Apium graveolens]
MGETNTNSQTKPPSKKSIASSSGMDTSNPYFVHHSDQPGHMLVPIKLDDPNYPSWSKSMVHALTAKNKVGFIDGTIEQPLEKEEDRMMQFLMGLSDTYNVVRSNILMMSPLLNVRQAYSLVFQDETQRQMTSESLENFSIAAAIQSRPSNFSNKFKNKQCHTEDRCKFKNGMWTPNNNTGNQNSRYNQSHQQHGSQRNTLNSFHTANTIDSSNSTHGVRQQDSGATTQVFNLLNPLNGLSSDQLQQLANTLSMMASNDKSGNNNAFANAAGLGYEEDDWLG